VPVKKQCFVVMAIGDQAYLVPGSPLQKPKVRKVSARELALRYRTFIRPAVSRALALLDPKSENEVERVDHDVSPGPLPRKIWSRILTSDYTVVDLTYPNPNVFYELGLRHASRVGTVLICESNAPVVAFDIRHLTYLQYTLPPILNRSDVDPSDESSVTSLQEEVQKQAEFETFVNGLKRSFSIFQDPERVDCDFMKEAREIEPLRLPMLGWFPEDLERAIFAQARGMSFYKTGLEYKVAVANAKKTFVGFETTLSYELVNKTTRGQEWTAGFHFGPGGGSIDEVRVESERIPISSEQRRTGGTLWYGKVPSCGRKRFSIRAQEKFPRTSNELYSTTTAATDMTLSFNDPSGHIVFEAHSFHPESGTFPPVNSGGCIKLTGVLPYQGIRLKWR
jgi:hypothetical protein